MYPCAAVPYAVTVLYVFAVVNLTALLNISLVEASVRVLNKKNETLVEVDDIEASFGPDVPEDGIQGHLMYTNPKNACAPVERVPPEFRGSIALIERNNCNFTDKVINAQRAGYRAAIVHNLNSDILIPMHGSGRTHIPSVFIGFHSAQLILQMLNVSDNCTVIILPNMSYIDVLVYFIPFAVVVALSFLTMLVIMAVKWYRDYRVKRRNRLSKTNLKKLPIKKFKKGDPYDVCAICLEEYEEGDKLRILPCTHGYHQKCVDPWLTKNRKLCPICKRKIRGGESDSSSDDDNHQPNQRNNERTPLLNNVTVRAPSQRDNEQTPLLNSTAVQTSENSASNQQDLQDGNAPQRGWDVFVNSIRRELPHATPSSEDYSSSQYASSVEVHEAHSAGCMADNPLIVAHMLPSHMLASDPLKNKPEEPLPGAVGDDSLFNNDTDTSELLASSRDGNDDRAEAEVKLKNKGKGNKKKTRKNHSHENV